MKHQQSIDSKGRRTWGRKTSDAIVNLRPVVSYLQDPPGMVVYRETPPDPDSPHGLSEWSSQRLESALEHFHQLLAHYANTGMSSALAAASGERLFAHAVAKVLIENTSGLK